MPRKFRIIMAMLVLLTTQAYTQRSTNSVYSRYGIGDLTYKGFARSSSMGGISAGLRLKNNINYLNPASYTSQDTLSFIFDFGVRSAFNSYTNDEETFQFNTFNIDHLAIGFPVTRWWKSSVGLVPYSSMGYKITSRETVINNPEDTVIKYFEGTGGITQLYFGNSFELFDHVSLGMNVSYLFGSLDKTLSQEFEENSYYNIFNEENSTRVGGFHYRFGLQYHEKISENFSFVIGGTVENQNALGTRSSLFSTSTRTLTSQNSRVPDVDTIMNQSGARNEILLPTYYGAGLTFKYKNNLTAGIDYFKHNWSEASFLGEKDSITNSSGYALGLEYVHDPASFRAYWHTIRFRAGGYFNDTYFKINGIQLNEYGMTFGLGFPIRNSNSMFNIGLEIGQRGTTENNLIQENFKRLNFSFTLYDFWFIKRKFD
ncbi:MAG: hypothetical protein ACLFUC_05635 [Bacteroidales bacterium]